MTEQQQPITLMTEQITLDEALRLVDFDQGNAGTWYVSVVKGNCDIVKGSCDTVEGGCRIVKGDCCIVEGRVFGTINGRQWQYVETPKEQMARLIKEGASKEELLKALEELNA
jgi:hypothetical protein